MNKRVSAVVLVSGGGTNLQALLDAVEDGSLDIDIAAVISNTAQAQALDRAQRYGVPALCIPSAGKTRDAYEKELTDAILQYEPDCIVFAGYLRVLTDTFFTGLRGFTGPLFNIHPSLLPAFGGEGMYGSNVHTAVIKSGAKISGCTVHLVTGDVDAGPIVMQAAVPVLSTDTPETLAARVLAQEHVLYPRALRAFAEGRLRFEKTRVIITPKEPLDGAVLYSEE